ncbi:MAG: hypothetical protein WAU86_07885 [Oricola sp.]
MVSDSLPPHQHSVETSRQYIAEGSYVGWAAILAGGIFALAISSLLIEFGTSLGLSLTSPYRGEGASAAWLAIAAGIWFAWVMVSGFGAGGYLAGRMRRRTGDATAAEVEVRDGAHGLMVWATGALVGTTLAAMGVGGLLNAGASAVGSVTEVSAEAFPSDYFANVMLRSAVSEPRIDEAAADTAPATAGTGATAEPTRQSTQRATNIAEIDPAIQQQIAGIIARSVVSGDMAERDRSYLAQLVAANSDLDRTAARTRVDEVNAELASARAEALAAVEKTRVAGVVFGFIAAATLLIGAVAAFAAATVGGRHRDEGLGLDALMTRR